MYTVVPLGHSKWLARDDRGLGTWLLPSALKKTNAERMKDACVWRHGSASILGMTGP